VAILTVSALLLLGLSSLLSGPRTLPECIDDDTDDEDPDVPSSKGSKTLRVAYCSLSEDSSDLSSLVTVCSSAKAEFSESELSSSSDSLSSINSSVSISTGPSSRSTGRERVDVRLRDIDTPPDLESVLLSETGKIRSSSKSNVRLRDGGRTVDVAVVTADGAREVADMSIALEGPCTSSLISNADV
jgi:hypothetical protein